MPSQTIADFSGGITDTPFTSPENCGEAVDNFLITKDKSLETVPGIGVYSATAYRLPSQKRVSLIKKLPDGNRVAFSNQRAYYITDSAISEITGPTGNKAFNLGDENSIVSAEFFNGALYATSDARPYQIRVYIDENGDPQLRTAGLPELASDPTITSAAGSATYIYAFVYRYEYYVGTTKFIDYGPPRYVRKTSMAAPMTISAFPTLSNGTDYNWDTATIVIEAYRTTNNGSVFYYVGETVNGSGVNIVDSSTDSSLITQLGLYTNGGIVPNDMPDPCKFIFEANDTYYNLNVLQSNEEKPFRFRQSITNDPDSVPSDFFKDLKGTIVGGSGVGRSAIVLTDTQTVRIDGVIDETGVGSLFTETISHTVGGISHNGIVKTSKGIYYPGTDGFYYTDGFSTPTKLAKKEAFSSKIDETYKALIDTEEQRKRIQGAYDGLNNRVYWVAQEDESDNDKIYVYDETHDSFTSLSNEGGIRPTSIEIDGDDIILGDSQGYIFKMNSSYFTHPVIDTSTTPDNWDETTIIYRWKSVNLTGGAPNLNKWWNKINVQGNPESNINMAILSYSNGEDTYKELFPVRIVPSLEWGDPSFTWGDDAFVWDRVGTLNQTRRFPAGRLRARQRQIEFTNAYHVITESTSDAASYITTNGTTKICTLVTPASYSFGTSTEGYNLVIDDAEYEILSGTEDTLTVSDPDSTLTSGTYPWQIKGKSKGQRAHILNFTVDFEYMSDAGTQWRGSAS